MTHEGCIVTTVYRTGASMKLRPHLAALLRLTPQHTQHMTKRQPAYTRGSNVPTSRSAHPSKILRLHSWSPTASPLRNE